MSHWGEIADIIDLDTQELLSKSVGHIIVPSEYAFNQLERFKANPYFKQHQQSSSIVVKENLNKDISSNENSPKTTTSPFFEIIKLMLTKDSNSATTTNINSEENDNLDSNTISSSNDDDNVSRLMRESIILILTHAGFDYAHNLAIDLLVDVLEYYLNTFAKLFRHYTDSIQLQSPHDFYDILDKTLHHMNVPNMEVLRIFHNELLAHFHRLKNNSSTIMTDKIKSN